MERCHKMRIYPLSLRGISEEEIAAVIAMTSRSGEALEEIARTVSPAKASEFHETWVLKHGHASVSEHSVVRLAVENISRLACDDLEDNRLGSYTEKSSRYQVMKPGFYHTPQELEGNPIKETYVETCEALLTTYRNLTDDIVRYLRDRTATRENEQATPYEFRLMHTAVDSSRMLLPAATLTTVGITMNARVLRHAIEKLLSSELEEMRVLGSEIAVQATSVLPTLAENIQPSKYLKDTREAQKDIAQASHATRSSCASVRLVEYDPDAERRIAAAVLYHHGYASYEEARRTASTLTQQQLEQVLDEALSHVQPQELPIRELEYASYTFDIVMDYGAYREFKRHRMQTYIAQPLTVDNGYVLPDLIVEAGKEVQYRQAMQSAEKAFHNISQSLPCVAQYLVTHGHYRRVLARMDARELYHFFRMRTSPYAHYTIREVAMEMLRLVTEKHPLLFKYLKLRTG